MKTCTRCGVRKVESEFSLHHPRKKNGILNPNCKECIREKSRRQYRKNPQLHSERMKAVRDKAIAVSKGYVSDYLDTHPCVDCGEADRVVLDFDHVRGDKVCEVSVMVGRGYRLWRITEEIEKCEVRCANCHRRVTAKRRKEQALIV